VTRKATSSIQLHCCEFILGAQNNKYIGLVHVFKQAFFSYLLIQLSSEKFV
jgi:hypothetical protein